MTQSPTKTYEKTTDGLKKSIAQNTKDWTKLTLLRLGDPLINGALKTSVHMPTSVLTFYLHDNIVISLFLCEFMRNIIFYVKSNNNQTNDWTMIQKTIHTKYNENEEYYRLHIK